MSIQDVLNVTNKILENSLASGVISGIVSSVVVTNIYRKIDMKEKRYKYISELCDYIYKLFLLINTPRLSEIEDEYIIRMFEYITSENIPIKEKWIRLQRDEKRTINEVILFINELNNKIIECKLEVDRKNKGETEFIDRLNELKLEISCVESIKTNKMRNDMFDIKNNYMK